MFCKFHANFIAALKNLVKIVQIKRAQIRNRAKLLKIRRDLKLYKLKKSQKIAKENKESNLTLMFQNLIFELYLFITIFHEIDNFRIDCVK